MRYVRGIIEASFLSNLRHNFAFWADLLPSVKSKGPAQMYGSVSDQTADFRVGQNPLGSTTEDRSRVPNRGPLACFASLLYSRACFRTVSRSKNRLTSCAVSGDGRQIWTSWWI